MKASRVAVVKPSRPVVAKPVPPEPGEPSAGSPVGPVEAPRLDPRIENLQDGARRAFEELLRRDGGTGAPQPAPGPGPGQGTEPAPRPSANAALEGVPLEALKALFRRPAPPPDERADIVALGRRLFAEKKLSSDHKMSCATCHVPERAFVDGRPRARGNRGQALPRNTPTVFNLAEAKAFYWDGRVTSLDAQAKDAIEREGEMDSTPEAASTWLLREPSYVEAFGRAFAGAMPSGESIVRALAAYQRTLVSPPTRFDRFVEGDGAALDAKEVAGFRVFTGKGRCLACHGGWRFTDDKFHDIGLRTTDRGRGALPGAVSEARAFKTPSLRELVWTAPYMHDGQLRSLDDAVAHYAGKLERRPSIASELKTPITLTAQEQGQLILFLKTLSSAERPRGP